jgi:hypothetical protein
MGGNLDEIILKLINFYLLHKNMIGTIFLYTSSIRDVFFTPTI